MAEVGLALLPVLFENIFNKLRSVVSSEFRLLQGGSSEDINKLSSTLSKFQHVLRDAEVKDFKSAATRDWLRRLKHTANEADGILDDALDSDSDDDDDNQTRVCHPFPPCFDINRVANCHKLGERIRSVTHKFDILDSEKSTLDFGEISIKRETTSTSSEPEVFGIKEAKEEMTKTLLKDADILTSSPPFIYAIVGLGGIGKTTLAQLIYNDEKMMEKFDKRLWVWVSQTFDVKIVMKRIIEAYTETSCQIESLETIENHLNKLLKGKKIFIVLDDIWISNEDLSEWNKLKSALKCGAIGSSIILTTRQDDVASIAGSHDRHNMALLSEDQCWLLFKESSFLEEKHENGDLELIGKQIVKKCGGLPLAVKNLGGSLRLTRVVSEWESVRDSGIWELERSCDILPALKLSLNRLESHSRDCFAFCSIFPKGYGMTKEDLVHLWMANGLVPSRRRLELEDMANKILNELVLKSFFQISRGFGIKMHDLMHDLGCSFRNECFCLEGPDVSIVPPRILQLSISFRDALTPNILEILSKSHPFLHTCILINPYIKDLKKQIIYKNLDCLRALDLSLTEMNNLPVSIGKSEHLRYLNLSWTDLTYLPDSICNLTKLQTLILRRCTELTQLPDGIARLINLKHLDISDCYGITHLPVGISQMTNLRHLNISGCLKLTALPNGIGQLVYLRTLGMFFVGQETGQRITELQGLNHLRGTLMIRGLVRVRDAGEAKVAILKEKKSVTTLILLWRDVQGSNDNSDKAEGVLEALQPPQGLINLRIRGYGGSVFASWIKLLENLRVIFLSSCSKCERLPPLGQLPLLKNLRVEQMMSLKCIGAEFYGSDGCSGYNISGERRRIFPSLEKLRFADMPMLEEWQATDVMDRQQPFPCPRLKELALSHCPKLTLLPPLILSFVPRIRIDGCDKVILRSLPCLASLVLAKNNIVPDESLQNLDALESLRVEACNELTSLPKGLMNLTSLTTLNIMACPALQSLPVMRSSLVDVGIEKCPSLKSLSQSLRDLWALESLRVSSCDQLEFSSDDFKTLISLKNLQVHSLPKLTSFSNLHYLSTLQTLNVEYCDNLTLWPQGMQNLRVLTSLIISHCDQLELSTGDFQHLINLQTIHLIGLNKLTSLPEMQHLLSLKALEIRKCQNLKILPQWLQSLSSLQKLCIEGCHCDVHLRCDKDKGEYWPFISHIPELVIKD